MDFLTAPSAQHVGVDLSSMKRHVVLLLFVCCFLSLLLVLSSLALEDVRLVHKKTSERHVGNSDSYSDFKLSFLC